MVLLARSRLFSPSSTIYESARTLLKVRSIRFFGADGAGSCLHPALRSTSLRVRRSIGPVKEDTVSLILVR